MEWPAGKEAERVAGSEAVEPGPAGEQTSLTEEMGNVPEVYQVRETEKGRLHLENLSFHNLAGC